METEITVVDKINLARKAKGSPLTVREIRSIFRSSK